MEQEQPNINNPEKTEKIGANRQPDGTFGVGNIANPDGRPKETEEQKVIKKAKKEAIKEFIKDYKEKLAEALPLISPILINKALGGDIVAIKEIHDRVMGRPETKTDITSGGEKINPIPILEIKDSKDICLQESTKEQNQLGTKD